jgi:hypothetical protein
MKFDCDYSYRHYLEVLNFLKNTHEIGPIGEIQSLQKNEKFVLLRHDVDFSLKSALNFAKVEAKKHFFSTYFVLLHSPYYNALSPENISRIKQISELGHEIGLHYDLGLFSDERIKIIKHELEILKNICSKEIKSIAPHNVATSSKERIFLKNTNDAYNMRNKNNMEYISDSVQNWRKQCMCNHVSKNKIQILTHPLWWNKRSLDRNEIYEKFENENKIEVNQEIIKLKKYHKLYFKIIKKEK